MQKERATSVFPNSRRKLLLLAKPLLLLLLLAVGFFPICLAEKKKILCLHGGGGTGEGFASSPGMQDLETALSGSFELVYANGGYPVAEEDVRLWIPDPPGGKKEPTQDPAFSDASIAALDDLRASEGPFAGILGYSQGAAYVPVYLSRVPPNTFGFALMFCGYPTLTHLGILEVVQNKSPFGGVHSLVWMGANDFVIPPELTRETIPFFASPLVVESDQGGHAVPGTDDPTFEQVVSFIESNGSGNGTAGTDASSPPPSRGSTNAIAMACLMLCFAVVSMT